MDSSKGYQKLWLNKDVTGTTMREVLLGLQIRALRSCENEVIDP